MNCQEAEELVSVLYDGERVPADCADHVESCAACRARLRAYSEMGAELRLMASRTPATAIVPPELLKKLISRRRIRVPRFAVGLAAGLILALTPSLMILRAQQNRPLWVQFTVDPDDGSFSLSNVAKAADDNVTMGGTNPSSIVGIHIVVSEVKEDSVKLGIRARRYVASNADQLHIREDMPSFNGHTYTYIPGKALEIPIEGGGTLVLKGHVVDHQPRSIGGIPVEPDTDQLVLSNPVLISGNTVLFNEKGANGLANGGDEAIAYYAPGTGLLRFALQPFPGAVKGEAYWGNLYFKLDGRSYSVLAATQICGGDQPRAVWVKNDAEYTPTDELSKKGFLGIDKLSAPRF